MLTILVVGVMLRGLLIAWFHGEPLYIDDERSYATIAERLAVDGEFAAAPGLLTSLRPPLYPGLVAAVYELCGVDNFTAVRIVQGVLSLVTVVVVHRMARSAYDLTTANVAAAAVAFYPSLLMTTNLVLTETLFALLVCCLCLAVQEYLRTPSAGWAAAIGVALGLAALTRSVLWPFPVILVGFLVCAGCAGTRRRGFVHATIAVAVFAAVLAPWSIRNSRLQETFVAVDVMEGRNLMMGNYEYTPMYRAWDAISVTGEQSWDSVLRNEHPTSQHLTQGQLDRLAMRRGLQYMLENPMLTMHRTAIKFLNFWQIERELVAGAEHGYWKFRGTIAVLCLAAVVVGSYVAAMWTGIMGFLMTAPADPRWKWFVVCLIGFVCLVHSVVFGHSRYHLPLMPMILIFSAAAVVQWRSIWSRRNGMFAVGVAACLLLACGWVWEAVGVDAQKLRDIF